MKIRGMLIMLMVVLSAQPALAAKKKKVKKKATTAASAAVIKAEPVKEPVKEDVKEPIAVEPVIQTVKEDDQYTPPKPFDSTITTLPVGYTGDNIVALYKKLTNEVPPKKESESVKAYQQRVDAASPKGVFCFLRENGEGLKEWGGNQLSYNTEKQIMTVERHDISSGHDRIKIRRIIAAPGEFGSSNSDIAKDYGIVLANKSSFRDKGISFRILPDEAQDLKSNFGLLYISRVKASGEPSTLTIADHKSKFFYREFLVSADVYEVWIFNTHTGVIYTKATVYW